MLAFSSVLRRTRPSSFQRALHVCVVGAGPAGFYTVDSLLKRFGNDCKVDLVEKLPVPYGLVRYGVAPDHPEVKITSNLFDSIIEENSSNVNFIGGVAVGEGGVPVSVLRSKYDAVIFCCGASRDRDLGIPGELEATSGVYSAREFVEWYNGHPRAANAHFSEQLKKAKNVCIAGQGNVAVDVARILLRSPRELAETDITDYALNGLKKSSVRHVTLMGRRGPVQAAFTTKEVRELAKMNNVDIQIKDTDLSELNEASQQELAKSRPRKRLFDLLLKQAVPTPSLTADTNLDVKTVRLAFYRKPVEVLLDGKGKVNGLVVQKTVLEGLPGSQFARAVDEFETLKCDILFKSIGYKSEPIEGLPFDDAAGVIPNRMGQVVDANGEDVTGVFVAGWIKRGPSGIIPTNKTDAAETVEKLAAYIDGRKESAAQPAESLGQYLRDNHIPSVNYEGSRRIFDFEAEAGRRKGKPSEKVVNVDEMMQVALIG